MSKASPELRIPATIPELQNYFGSKAAAGVAQKLISRIPAHDTLVVPFLGHCAITRNIRIPKLMVLNDIDMIVTDSWSNALEACGWQKASSSKGLSKAARTFVDRYRKLEPSCSILVFADDGQHEIILTNGDGINALMAAPNDRSTFAYLDPPYMMRSRKSQRKIYNFESNMEIHERTFTYLQDKRFNHQKMLSHYADAFYDDRLTGYQTFDFQSMTRGGLAEERVYMNYSVNESDLHDYRFVGDNYKERERIQLKVKRHLARLKKLDPVEREAIITAIIEQFR